MNKITLTRVTLRVRKKERVFTFILNDGVELTFNSNGTVDFHCNGMMVPDAANLKELLESGVDALEIDQRDDRTRDQCQDRTRRLPSGYGDM